MEQLVSSLIIISSLVLVKESKAELKPSNVTTDGRLYQLKNDTKVGYENNWILGKIEEVSRAHCLLRCEQVEHCEHVAFNEALRRCKLLRKIYARGDQKLDGGEKIYSPVAGKSAGEQFSH